MVDMNTFKEGDMVEFDLSNPENKDVLSDQWRGRLNLGVFTITGTNGSKDQIDLDRPLFENDSHGMGWFAWRFKLAKNHIVTSILRDL